MINSDKINNLNKNNSKNERKNGQNNNKELISPLNYTWKGLFTIMNKIKLIWHINKYDNVFMLDSQSLYKCIYNNLKFCDKTPNLRMKNNILETDFNSFFQTNLFGYISEEQEIYDYYDNAFKKKKYIPKIDENEEILFGDFIIKYKDIFYSIQKNKKSMRQLKKIRWYMIMDEDNFFETEIKNNIFNINNTDFFLDFSKEIENNNDSFDEEETKIYYKEYLKNEKEKTLDILEEIHEKNIINDEIIDKLLNKEKNQIFYIIKLIYLSVTVFCKAIICHLLNYFSDLNECKYEDGKYLINRYLLCFNNFIDSCILINKKCININVAINYLYKELFEDYPDFPKFSIFRMCIRIWFTEANTHLIGKNTLFSKIKDKLASIFSNNLKEELFNKMGNNHKNENTFNSKSVNNEKSKSFNLSSSFMLFNSDNYAFNMNDYFSPFGFGSEYINTYDDSDKQYKILEKGLSIITDSFSNEYSVYLLNLSSIDTNTFYDELVQNFNNSITYYINEIFNIYSNDRNYDIKVVIDNILHYFDNYFFKTKIISNLRKKIYDTVYLEIKNNLLEYIKNKYLDNDFFKNKKEITFSNKSNNNSISTKSNLSSNFNSESLLKSSIFNFNFNENDENDEIKDDIYKKQIIDYIIKNTGCDNLSNNEIEKKLDYINKQINIYDLFNSIEKWNEEHINLIKKNDQKIMEELININLKMNINVNIPLTYNKFKRYLLSYSLQYDWAFIKKVKNIENYLNKNNTNEDEDINMELNNNNELGLGLNYFNNLDNIDNNNNNGLDLNYFNNLNNIGNINNNNNIGGFNLRSSFFDY